jgi:predicted GH43/DUF377 family glycosyl hydrolase
MRARRWKKLGRVCDGPGNVGWAASHAALPIVHALGDRRVRVYFSSRDAAGRSHIGVGALDLSAAVPRMTIDPSPVLGLGPIGAFDDSGVTSSSLVEWEGRSYLYYTGWTRGVTVPFYLFAGVAVSDGGEPFRRASPAPILERNAVDPYLTASPWVLVDNGVWRMWYVSAVRWTVERGAPKHYYHIRYAESSDGLNWQRNGTVSIDFCSADEHAFGRPCVLRERDGSYRMWYSYRGEAYRIGYAESADGVVWHRRDADAGIEPSSSGWDAEMIEYPAVFDVEGRRYMLYNGADYGRTGVGLAILE